MTGARQTIKNAVRIPAEFLLQVYLSSIPRVEFAPEKVNRILVFAYHGLGNFIMYTPALKLLRQRYPNARIDLQVGNATGCEEVLAGAGLFDHIYNLPYSAGVSEWIAHARKIRAIRYDVTINEFHSHSWPLALLVSMSGAPFRLGHVTSPGWSRRFSRYSFVFNMPIRMSEDQHEIDRYLDLVGALDARPNTDSPPGTFIHLEREDREFASAFFGDKPLEPQSKIIGVQPGTSPTMRWKQWPAERYREVIERVIAVRPNAQIVLFGSAGEREMIDEMASGFGPNVRVAAGKTTVKQVAALIERCDLLLCNDSGLMHVAGAVGTPVVAIYGPTDIKRTAPLGAEDTVVRHELPCSPCFKLEGDDQVHLCPHHDCLMTIEPVEVFQIVRNAVHKLEAGETRGAHVAPRR